VKQTTDFRDRGYLAGTAPAGGKDAIGPDSAGHGELRPKAMTMWARRLRFRKAAVFTQWSTDMRPLRMDFIDNREAFTPAALASLAVGAIALIAAIWAYSSASAEHETLTAAANVAPAADPTVGESQAHRRTREADAKRSAKVLANLTVPWPALFTALESAAGEGILLTGLMPEAENRRVRISGEARHFQDIPMYTKKLLGTKAFANVLLLSHDTLDNRRIAFTLQADWTETAAP
jgi:hypothetical protein